MSDQHVVLARKYRPQTFSNLIGQEVLSTTIKNAIRLDRVAHAYLLTGIRGIGKTTTARIVAKALNCTNLQDSEPCNECDNCQEIKADRHIDVIEIDAASNTGVDNVREIIENSKYAPNSAKYKVYIIDEVHMLSKAAFNALLKTLEEPPSHTKFILATTEIKKVPVTIISRCHRFELKRIKADELTDFLKSICKKESIKFEEDAIKLIVNASEGSVRDSLSILDQAASYGEAVSSKSITEMLGYADKKNSYKLLKFLLQGKALEAVNLFKELVKDSCEPEVILNQLLEKCYEISIIKIGGTDKHLVSIDSDFDSAKEIADQIGMSVVTNFNHVIVKSLEEIKISRNSFIVGEMALIKLSYLSSLPKLEDIVEDLKKKPLVNNVSYEESSLTEKIESKTQFLEKPDLQVDKTINKTSKHKLPEDFKQIVELFNTNQEIILYSNLYDSCSFVKLHKNQDNYQIIVSCDDSLSDADMKKASNLVSKWLGFRYNFVKTESDKGETLKQQEDKNKAKKLEMAKTSEVAKHVFSSFPEAEITSIKPKDNK